MDHKVRPPQHQVFINFRGDELRTNFFSHLLEALERNGINLFTDKKEKRGEYISNLFKRIEESKIAIVVFSKRYTESRWCLGELVKIKECVDLGKLKVLPIFYNVSTNDVKGLKGEFSDHLRDREKEFQHDQNRIKQWKEAMSCISSILGLTFHAKSHFSSSSESNFIGDIVKNVLRMLQEMQNDHSTFNKITEKGKTSSTKKNSKKSIKTLMGNTESPPQAISSGHDNHIKIEITHVASSANASRLIVPRVHDPHTKVVQGNYDSSFPGSAGKGDSSSTTNKSKKPLKPSKGDLKFNGWPS